MASITQEIKKLQTMTVPELVKRYEQVCGKEPHCKNKAWLVRRTAWELQAQQFGGLGRPAKKRLDEIMATLELPVDSKKSSRTHANIKPRLNAELKVGSTLVRTWHGREYQVEVTEDGFEYDGVLYRSLSAVAKAITGAHWNGRLFFNLITRKSK